MRLFWLFSKHGRHQHRVHKELAALGHLRQFLEGEESRLDEIDQQVKIIEAAVEKGDFENAELFVPKLLRLMTNKGLMDKAEKDFLKRFKNTLLRDLRKQVSQMRKATR